MPASQRLLMGELDAVWARPGLTMRDRRLVTLAVLATGPDEEALRDQVEAALQSGEITADELDEVVVQVAHLAGGSAATRLRRVAGAAGPSASTLRALGPIGVVGLGEVGRGLAAKAAAAGSAVVLLDADTVLVDRVAATLDPQLVTSVATFAELTARCAVVSVAVRDDAQLGSVLDGPEGLVATCRPGSVVLVHSTVRPDAVRRASADALASGVAVVDAAVSGSLGMHTRSRYTVMIGGPADVVERVRPLLDAYAQSVLHLGPVGAGLEAKLVRNAAAYGGYAATSEAMALATGLGIDAERAVEVLRCTALLGPALELYVRNRWLGADVERVGGDVEGRRFVALGRKDLEIAREAGRSVGVEMPVGRAVGAAMDMVFAAPPARSS